ncbi:MAG: tetratricopeptide repeat protein, partial [Pseudomonadales bacterium]
MLTVKQQWGFTVAIAVMCSFPLLALSQVEGGVSAVPGAPAYGFSTFTIQQGAAASPEGLLPSFEPVKSLQPGKAGVENNIPEAVTQDQSPSSKTDWDKLVTRSAHNQDKQIHGEVLRGYAQSQQARGDYYNSVKTLADALTIAKQADDPFRIAASLGGMGNALLAAGKQSSAEKILLEAIDVAKQIDDHSLSARLYNNLGNYYAVQEQQVKALSAYQNSASLLAKSTLPKATQALEMAKAYANIARIHLYVGSHKRAMRALAQAKTEIRSAAQNEEYTSVLIHLAKSYEQIALTQASQMRNSLLAAHALLQQAAKRSRATDDNRLLSYALGNLGALYQIEG